MPAIVEFPHVLSEATEYFAELFSNKPQQKHFAEYLTGQMDAENNFIGLQFGTLAPWHPGTLPYVA